MIDKLLDFSGDIIKKYGLWAFVSIVLLGFCGIMYYDMRNLQAMNNELQIDNNKLQTQSLYWMQSINFVLEDIETEIEEMKND